VARLTRQLAARTASEAALRAEHEDLVSRLVAKVECPVCFELPKEVPVSVCPNGHVICRSCRRESCPTCRARMGPGTSLLAVTVIESVPHRCQFELAGCPAQLGLQELRGHQARCRFRPVRCPNFSCTEQLPLAALAGHTLRGCVHNSLFYNSPLSNNYNYIIPANQQDQFDRRRNSTWRPDGLTYDGNNFFLKITRKGKKGNWYFYVQMAGGEEEGAAYTATIFVHRTGAGLDSRNSHRFIGEVCPIDLSSVEAAAEAGCCQILTDAQMRKVFTEGERGNNKKFGFSVRVELSQATPGEPEPAAEPAAPAGATSREQEGEAVRQGGAAARLFLQEAAGSIQSRTVEGSLDGAGPSRERTTVPVFGRGIHQGRALPGIQPTDSSGEEDTVVFRRLDGHGRRWLDGHGEGYEQEGVRFGGSRRFERIAVAATDSTSEDETDWCLHCDCRNGITVHSPDCPLLARAGNA
jgi:hypothetical protein